MSLLDVNDLNVGFQTRLGTVRAVNNVSFEIDKGEVFGLIGESGSGKSVIGMSLLHLLPRNARVRGRAIFEGSDLLALGEEKMQKFRGRRSPSSPRTPLHP